MSPHCEMAIADALGTGTAILKFISANDVDLTGGHQGGFYLPKSFWQMFTTIAPDKGTNGEQFVKVLWQDGRTTDSRIIWYGKGTRSEYRLTRFGKDFPFRTFDNLGDLLVLVPVEQGFFRAYVLFDDEDMAEIQAALGVEIINRVAAYTAGHEKQAETPDECIDRQFREFMKALEKFPPTAAFSTTAREALEHCVREFKKQTADQRLTSLMEAEYRLFRMVERQICQKEIQKLFKDVDDFIHTAQSITNRRKSRAGRSLENHVAYLLDAAAVPYAPRPRIDGKVEPDILIPSKEAYEDPNFPTEHLCVVGVKTTCKDRWRQVLSEGKRIEKKHILTVQPGISSNQLAEMREKNVTLIVPQSLHKEYPKDTGINLLTVEQFIADMQARPWQQLGGAA